MQDARLVIEGSGNWAYTVYLSGQATFYIGRGISNDIRLDDTICSNRHAEITVEDQRCILRDRNSRNGTHVNGEKIRQHTLRQGDEIRIGHTTMFFMDDEAHSTRAAADTAETPLRLERPRLAHEDTQLPDQWTSRLIRIEMEAPEELAAKLHELRESWDDCRRGIEQKALRRLLRRALDGNAGLNERLNLAIGIIAAQFVADCAFIMMIHPESGKWIVRAHHGESGDWMHRREDEEKPPLSLSVAEKCVQTGQLQYSRFDTDTEFCEPTQSMIELEINSWICAPLQATDEAVRGVLYVDRRRKAPPLEAAHCPLMETFAGFLQDRL
ncbi:FHA domain-containing protein [Candidatus Sumerlaeota bacterium]|nr:FHA domain-containing protein [Candidatus Sumerlaeota bacterium]